MAAVYLRGKWAKFVVANKQLLLSNNDEILFAIFS